MSWGMSSGSKATVRPSSFEGGGYGLMNLMMGPIDIGFREAYYCGTERDTVYGTFSNLCLK